MLTKIEGLSANGIDKTTGFVNLSAIKGFDIIDTKDKDGNPVYEIYLYLDGYNRAIRMELDQRIALVDKLLEGNK